MPVDVYRQALWSGGLNAVPAGGILYSVEVAFVFSEFANPSAETFFRELSRIVIRLDLEETKPYKFPIWNVH